MYSDRSKMFDLGDCIQMEYSQTDDMEKHEFKIKYIKKQMVFNKGKYVKTKSSYILGDGFLTDPIARQGQIQIKLSKYFNYYTTYNIIDTDYVSYAIVYYCETIMCGLKKFE